MTSGAEYDAVVVGLGPGGATVASHLCRRGRRVLGIEYAPFPRYHIGESLTGTVGLYLRRVGLEAEMKRRGFPVKYGVTVMGRAARNEFFVAAAPEPTWQVRREDFDEMLLDNAVTSGLEVQQAQATGVLTEGERVTGVRLRGADGSTREVRAGCVVDASGGATFLARHRIAGERVHDDYVSQVAVFTQLQHSARDPGLMAGNTVIFYNQPHHWAWFIPLDAEVDSVGIVVKLDTYLQLSAEARAQGRPVGDHVFEWGLRAINPDLERRCLGRTRVEPVRVLRDFCYRIEPFAGPGWLCVGDAHRFLDPIFSFGVSLALEEAQLAAAALHAALETGDWRGPLAEYQRRCNRGQDAIADVIRYFWRFPAFFGLQARGAHRADIMKLFAGAAYDAEPLPGLVMMRESLARVAVHAKG